MSAERIRALMAQHNKGEVFAWKTRDSANYVCGWSGGHEPEATELVAQTEALMTVGLPCSKCGKCLVWAPKT